MAGGVAGMGMGLAGHKGHKKMKKMKKAKKAHKKHGHHGKVSGRDREPRPREGRRTLRTVDDNIPSIIMLLKLG